MKRVCIIVIFLAFIPCYAQYSCDYNVSDYMIMLVKQEWDEIKKIHKEVIKDTLKLDSLVLGFYENGNLYTRIPYKNGTHCGFYEQYYSNGQICFRKYRIEGKIADGYYYYYAIDGSIQREGKYKNGVPAGH